MAYQYYMLWHCISSGKLVRNGRVGFCFFCNSAHNYLHGLTMNYYFLILLAVTSFIQNMAFTGSSRSRNSGDPMYHFKWALLSNGIWFANRIFSLSLIMDSLLGDSINWAEILIVGGIYLVTTSTGSAYMMSRMLKKVKGKQHVGAK